MSHPAGKEPPKERLFIALDIEKDGPLLSHPTTAIGMVWGDDYGTVFGYNTWFLKPEATADGMLVADMDPDTKTEFWDKYPEVRKVIESRWKPMRQELEAFAQHYDRLLQNFKESRKIVLLTDNAAFDIGNIDYLLQVTGVRNKIPLKNTNFRDPTGRIVKEYVSSEDPSSAFLPEDEKRECDLAASSQAITYSIMSKDPTLVGGKHFPAYDALENYFLFLKTDKVTRVAFSNKRNKQH